MFDFLEACRRGIEKTSWGTSQLNDDAACEERSGIETVFSGNVPSEGNLASFSYTSIFEFFNTIHPLRTLAARAAARTLRVVPCSCYCHSVPVTTMSTLRLPHREQTSRSRRDLCLGAVLPC